MNMSTMEGNLNEIRRKLSNDWPISLFSKRV